VRLTSILAIATIVLLSAGMGYAFSAALVGETARLDTESSSAPAAQSQDAIALAQAFTADLNAHDVDGLLELFTDEDAGPSVTADRYAWLKFEIRLWAQKQADTNLRMQAHEYRLTEQGAAWDADLYRDDWTAAGVAPLQVTNSIWVQNGRIANFTEKLRNSTDANQLGDLWRPGAAPERPPDPPPAVVANYLLARDMGDFAAAATWCAPLLELQDADESWFVDQPATADWLRQLVHRYRIDIVEEPHLEGNSVVWRERLTQRAESADLARMTIEIHAVIRDGKIAYLSGAYPAIPLRTSRAAPGEPAYVTHSNFVSGMPPGVLFLGSALGLGLLMILVATVGRLIRTLT
jgi:hypothetical protein